MSEGIDHDVKCPLCGAQCAPDVIDEHVNLHFGEEQPLREDEGQMLTENDSFGQQDDDGVHCHLCGEIVDIHDLDSHEEAHRLQQMESDQRSLQDAEEKRDFEELQMKFGFSDKRPGDCYRCGQEGHWSRECPANPAAAQSGLQQQPLSTVPSELVRVQQPDNNAGARIDVIPLLQACFDAHPKAHSTVYLCGPVAFHGRQLADSGWGCGYRNIQMQTSHQLMKGGPAQEELFGGAGFVPNIAAVQAWLEVAWQAGFDPAGAAMFGGKVQCSRKWIGASDAAALMRYFGCKALLTEFIAQPRVNEAGLAVHHNVQCDICHQQPITGIRHKSLKTPNTDVCSRCRQTPAAQQHAPYVPLGEAQPQASAAPPATASAAGRPSNSSNNSSRATSSAGGQQGSSQAGLQRHQALAEWVWTYFSQSQPMEAAQEGDALPGSSAAANPHAATAAGGVDGKVDAFAKLMRPASPVILTSRAPLYLQHEGHSRTIVGIERCLSPRKQAQLGPTEAANTAEYSLILLDPGLGHGELIKALRSQQGWQRLVKRGMHTLAKKQEYQILHIAPGHVPAGPQRDALKKLRPSDRYTT